MQMGQLIITQDDDGKTLDISEGDEIVVQLPENPSTGYVWAIEHRDRILTLQDNQFIQSQAETTGVRPVVGAGGVRALTLRAKGRGIAQLKLKRYRSWLGDSSIIERFHLTLRISDS
jgi:inhibitor of cysteine peptidase